MAPRTSTAARTCSRWAWSTGSTAGRLNRRSITSNSKFAQEAGGRAGQHAGAQGRLRLRRNRRAVQRAVSGSQGQAAAGQVSQDHRQRSGRDRHGDGRQSWRDKELVYCSYPITPASDILHNLADLQELQRGDLPGGRRNRRDGRGDRRELRRGAGLHRHQRAGHGAQGRSDRPGGDDRIAAGDHRRAARRAEHRPAHQDRTGGSASGDVRPQRRMPGAHHRRLLRRPIASTPRSKRSRSRPST